MTYLNTKMIKIQLFKFSLILPLIIGSCSTNIKRPSLDIPRDLVDPKGESVYYGLEEKNIVHFVNFGCSDCFMELKQWQNFLDSLNVSRALFIASGAEKNILITW